MKQGIVYFMESVNEKISLNVFFLPLGSRQKPEYLVKMTKK